MYHIFAFIIPYNFIAANTMGVVITYLFPRLSLYFDVVLLLR